MGLIVFRLGGASFVYVFVQLVNLGFVWVVGWIEFGFAYIGLYLRCLFCLETAL